MTKTPEKRALMSRPWFHALLLVAICVLVTLLATGFRMHCGSPSDWHFDLLAPLLLSSPLWLGASFVWCVSRPFKRKNGKVDVARVFLLLFHLPVAMYLFGLFLFMAWSIQEGDLTTDKEAVEWRRLFLERPLSRKERASIPEDYYTAKRNFYIPCIPVGWPYRLSGTKESDLLQVAHYDGTVLTNGLDVAELSIFPPSVVFHLRDGCWLRLDTGTGHMESFLPTDKDFDSLTNDINSATGLRPFQEEAKIYNNFTHRWPYY